MAALKFIFLFLAAGSALLYFAQDSLIFYSSPISQGNRQRFAKHEITFEREGIKLHGWLVKTSQPHNKPFIIYYGGNAEEVSGNIADISL